MKTKKEKKANKVKKAKMMMKVKRKRRRKRPRQRKLMISHKERENGITTQNQEELKQILWELKQKSQFSDNQRIGPK